MYHKLSRILACFLPVFLMTSALVAAASDGDDRPSGFDKILERYRTLMIEREQPSEGKVRELLSKLGKDGRWEDLDYNDQSRGNWHPYQHLQRAEKLAHAFGSAGHPLHGDNELHAAILGTLDDWIEHRYEAVNWWFNEIGAPRLMRDIIVLLDNRLDNKRREKLLEVLSQYRLRGTGANLVWTAELALHYGCLTGDADRVEEAIARIHKEITVGAPEGIQEDWSFFQHGPRLQTFHYGRSYLEVVAAVAWQLRGTEWAVPEEKIDALSRFILEGMQWMLRGRNTVPGTMDRMASRPGALRVDLRPILRFWRDVDPQRKDKIDEFIARQSEAENPLVGFRHFPKADFSAYHRPEFSFFLKTVSDRTHLTESINNENRLGENLNTGDHYWITDKSDYYNLPPVWDWKRLPGVTRAAGSLEIERKAFVGGLGDGLSGLTAMEVHRTKAENILAVRRFWGFHSDSVLALFGGWEVDGGEDPSPFTTLDQRRWRGEVIAGFADGTERLLQEGEHALKDVRYLWHDGVAYVTIEPAAVRVWLGEFSGSWRRINQNRSADPISEDLFLAVLEHGNDPQPGGFAMTAVKGPDQVDEWIQERPWEVLRNDDTSQAVLFGENTTMAAFYEPGTLEMSNGETLSVDRPCLALWSGGGLRLVDPTHEGGEAAIRWGEHRRTVTLPSNGQPIVLDHLRE